MKGAPTTDIRRPIRSIFCDNGAMEALYGRTRELSVASERLDALARGMGGVLCLAGEAGIGKSRLARAIAELGQRRGARVAWGRCWEVGGAPALWPWVEIFRTLSLEEEELTSASGDTGAQGRFRVLDRAVRTLEATSRRAPLLLICDDIHAGDVPSLDLLVLLTRSVGTCPILLVVAYRAAEAHGRSDVIERLASVARQADVLELGRLQVTDVAEWLDEACPGLAAAQGRMVYERSEGNPLFVRELLKLGASEGSRVTATLSSLLDARLARLSEGARRLLEAAAVLGREFLAADATALAELAVAEADRLAREAFDAGIVEARGDRLAFSHVLLRDRVHDTIAPMRRSALHHRAGVMLRDRGQAYVGAQHLLQGAHVGEAAMIGHAVLEGARDALSRLAFEDAEEMVGRALEVLGPGAERRLGVELTLVRAEALALAGRPDHARQTAVVAADLARRLGDAEMLARAALVYGQQLMSATVDPVMVAQLEEALLSLPPDPSPLRARVMARLASALTPPAGAEEADRVLRLARDARAMASGFDDPRERLAILEFVASAMGYMVGRRERFELASEVLELARALDRRATLAQMLGWHVASHLEEGLRTEAMAHLELLEEVLEDLPQLHYRWRLPAIRACVAIFDARWADAEEHSAELLRLADRAGAPNARAAWALQRIAIAQSTGEPASIARWGEQVLGALSRMPMLSPYQAWVLAAMGRPGEAQALLRPVVTRPKSFPWIIIGGDAAVLLADRGLAAPMRDALAAHHLEQRFFWGPAGASVLGPTSRTLGDLELLLGNADEAAAHYGAAVAECESIGAVALLELSRRGLEGARQAAGARTGERGPSPERDAVGPPRCDLVHDGDVWTVETAHGRFHLKHAKGLLYLSYLLGQPRRRIHVLELIGAEETSGDAGVVLDAKAKQAYRQRLDDLASALSEAESLGDGVRAARAQEEIDRIAEELARAVGLGGRDRRAASNVERARVNVQRRLKDTLERIAAADERLGRHLGRAIKTGTFCSYEPD